MWSENALPCPPLSVSLICILLSRQSIFYPLLIVGSLFVKNWLITNLKRIILTIITLRKYHFNAFIIEYNRRYNSLFCLS